MGVLVGIGRLLGAVPGWFWMGLAALLALWQWGNWREAHGRALERVQWETKVAVAKDQAQQLAILRLQIVQQSEAAAKERERLYAIARTPITNEVTKYVTTPAAASPCPDSDGVQLGQKAIDTANARTAAGAAR